MKIKLAVRKIVETVLRSGSIDNRYADPSAMPDGARIHRQIQKKYPDNCKKEVYLSLETTAGGETVTVHGRADGILIEADGTVVVDEIKTTTMSLERMLDYRDLHFGQAKCYAHMLLQTMENPPSEISVQLTLYQLETEETRYIRETYNEEELRRYFSELLEKYGIWLRYESNWKKKRDSTAEGMKFPYPTYRRGQRELAVAVYRTIERGKKLYAQAPTGIGKTLSALFPAIKAVGGGKAEKLFYLTAKTVTRTVAESAIRMLLEQGLHFKSVTLRAKEKICFKPEVVCNPEYCEYARGHYDRINEALLAILNRYDLIRPEETEEIAVEYRVCPHELGLDAAMRADLVICDYNHVFDPISYLKRFFAESISGDYVLLIDEAHNLADRVRDMYTMELRKTDFYKLKNRIKRKDRLSVALKRASKELNAYLLTVKKEAGEEKTIVRRERDEKIRAEVMTFIGRAGDWLAAERGGTDELYEEVLSLFFEVSAFAIITELYDEHYRTIYEIKGSDVQVTQYCLDPSEQIAHALKKACAVVMFSATLTPLPYYREILGGNEDGDILSLRSPFEPENMILLAHKGISTKYADREAGIVPICECIAAVVRERQGNYMAFFPSYEYMRRIYGAFSEIYPEIETIIQEGSMSEDERSGFLESFGENGRRLLGFCVLGGIFSEGIDLKGERLIGAVIVGVGLPKITMRQDLIKEYYNEKNGRGFDFAYVYPGMNKVLQAAGRVIRSETDKGVVLLIDSRYKTEGYRKLLPEHWSHIRYIGNAGEIGKILQSYPEDRSQERD